MNHYRKTMQKYLDRQKVDGCPFCNSQTRARSIQETSSVYVVANLTQYDLWELYDVTDHFLVIPKRHVKNLQELTERERLEIMDVLADYETKGYNIYARGADSARRSVEHQHTHVIKSNSKHPRFSLFLRKPYFLFKF